MNKPIFIDEKWFGDELQHNLQSRSITQHIALNLLNQLSNTPLIVETGTIRMENDWGAGMSTFVFGKYVSHYGGKIITIDISDENMKVCREVTKNYAQYITYVVKDSLEYLKYLKGINTKIDFLYLDSMDTPIEGDASESQNHNLNEFIVAEPMLNDRAIIMIDDVGFSNGGKAAKTHKYLIDNKYLLIFKHQQSIWLKI